MEMMHKALLAIYEALDQCNDTVCIDHGAVPAGVLSTVVFLDLCRCQRYPVKLCQITASFVTLQISCSQAYVIM